MSGSRDQDEPGGPGEPPGLLAIAEELYGLPLGDFTGSRDARVKELKGTPLAAKVKALKKPSTAAWVVDLLVRRDTAQVEQVLSVGSALREAQAGMDAAQLRELTKQRRKLTAAVTTRARALAREQGLKVTEAVAEQVEATLTAAMVDAEAARAVRSGLLVTALSATGVDAVDAAAAVALPDALGFEAAPVEAPPAPTLRLVPDPEPDETALEEAREALSAAEEEVGTARAEREDAVAEVERLEARVLQVQAEIDEVRRRLAELEETAQEIDDELSDAEDAREEADGVLAEAVRTREAAADALRRLER